MRSEKGRQVHVPSPPGSPDDDPQALAGLLKGDLIDPDQLEPGVMRVIDRALAQTVDDVGAPLEKSTIAALKTLRQSDPAQYARTRDRFKNANPRVSLKILDSLVLEGSRESAKKASLRSSPSIGGQRKGPPIKEAAGVSPEDPLTQAPMTTDGCLVILSGKGDPRLVAESMAAEKLAGQLKGRFTYSPQAQVWHRFTGTHWEECGPDDIDAVVVELLTPWSMPIGFSSNYLRGCLALLKKSQLLPLPSVPERQIPFANGLLNPDTFELTPTTPETATTWCLPYAWRPSAKCSQFLAWLAAAVDSDRDTIALVRAWINTILTGRADLQRFLHLYGPAGTGKSTLVRLVVTLVGKLNVITTDLRNLEQNRFETASLYGKRLVVINDADKYGGSVNVLKAMTGQDPLRRERKHQQQAGSFIFEGQAVIVSNEFLTTTDYTSGIERRRITIEFKRALSAEERTAWNSRGGEETILYSETPGIIRWALAMTRDEVDRIFVTPPLRTQEANLEAMLANNPIADWLLESTLPAPGRWTKIGNKQESRLDGRIRYDFASERLYPNYLTWCNANGREQVGRRRFVDRVIDIAKSFGIEVSKPPRSREGYGLVGLKIRQEYERRWEPLSSPKATSDAGGELSVTIKSPSEVNNDGAVNFVNQVPTTFSQQG